jgi:hypothetical protein
MRLARCRRLLVVAWTAAAAACPAPDSIPTLGTPPGAAEPLDIGPGDLEAYAVHDDAVALCLAAPEPRLLLAVLPRGPVTELPFPFEPPAGCERLAVGDDLVCVAAYDAGVACAPRDGTSPALYPALDGAPTGLAWDGHDFWIATDGTGLWRVSPDGIAERILDLPDLMNGLVAGPFGVVWGSGGEFVWRTRMLRSGAEDPEWLRPPLPPNADCRNGPEVCEWVSNAVGWYRGRVWFAAINAPAPLYTWLPDDGSWREFHVEGEVHVGPSGVFAVRADGTVEAYAPRRSRFEPAEASLAPGEAPVAAAGGLWAAGRGTLRLAIPGEI